MGIVLSYPVASKCQFFLPSDSWWVVGVRGIMSFAMQTRVKMNGCPFGSKMAIIIPTWCRQIKPPKPF